MTTLESGGCANCDRAITGTDQKFCPACGQPTPAHRIDWHFLGHELEHSVLHMDRGILYSLKELMLRPGSLMLDYLEGRRAGQVKPLLLLMITAAVVVFLGKYVLEGDLMGSAINLSSAGSKDATGDGQIGPAILIKTFAMVKDWMNQHFAGITLLLLPLEAAAFKLAFRRVGNLNYPEWLVITAFLTVQLFVLWALAVPLQRWVPGALAVVFWIACAYNIFSLMQFFRGYPRWKSALRGLLGLGLFLLVNMALTAALVVAVFAMS